MVKLTLALFDFQKQTSIASLLYHMKYHRYQFIGFFLGIYLAPKLQVSKVFVEINATKPLPLNPKRFKIEYII